MIHLQRVYNGKDKGQGTLFLVDGVWPRGIKKEELGEVQWVKEVAPSKELRKWFKHDPDKWDEFQEQYREELDQKPQSWKPILEAAREGDVTLLYGSKDEEHNQAVVLRDYLESHLKPKRKK
jgi:uncharacterized protein YeaO (DUF488 family)